MDVYAGRVVQAWEIIEPLVPLIRKRNGSGVWENFEFLVVHARKWSTLHPEGAYPKSEQRLPVNVTWPEPQ
ncbi:MAG: hypothetical protein M3Z37_01325 [Candidatus Eremiobacteraeota bacterium]|nr:hypothetical protein [Candidatus Eremiobacteraeota bacterium]